MAAQTFRIAARRGFEWQRHCESTSMLYQLLLSLKVPPPYKVRHMPAPIFQGAQVVARVALVMTSEKPDLLCNPVFTPWLSPAILCHQHNFQKPERLWKANCLWKAVEGKQPEKEVAGREPGNQSQGGNEVQSSIQDKKGLVNVFNSSLYRFFAKPSAPTSSRVTRSSPRSTRIRSDKHRYTFHCAEN